MGLTIWWYYACGQENIPVGTWRTHFSYNDTRHIAIAGDVIYASSENGLYYFDKEDNSIAKISKIDGLQGEDISSLYYSNDHDLLLIGYNSGNLDIIKGQEIINIDLTTHSQINDSKTINHVVGFQSYAYLATDFGVLKFDLKKLEVRETWREIGAGASTLRVNQGVVFHDSLFLATDEGVIAANLVRNINLLDHQNWIRFGVADGIPQTSTRIIALFDDRLIAGISNDALYLYDGQWQMLDILNGASYTFATGLPDRVAIIQDEQLSFITSDLQSQPFANEMVNKPQEVIEDKEGNLWIADGRNGLVSDFKGPFQKYAPSGPFSNEVFRLYHHRNSIYALPGGYGASLVPLGRENGYYVYTNGEWNNYNPQSSDLNIPEFKDIVDATHIGSDLFLASAGYGLLQIKDNNEKVIIDENTPGSPLENLEAAQKRTIIPAIAPGEDGLWVLNYGATNPLHIYKTDGSWQSYSFNLSTAKYPVAILLVHDHVWMVIDPDRGGGIFVYNPADGNGRYLTELPDNGGLANVKVRALALDLEGLVWVGTDNGVSVFSDPYTVLSGSVDAIEPIFENRDLLTDEKVTAIEVDGGNRKWIGTTNGVWLIGDNGDEQIAYFNTSNSPLPDNNIIDITINQQSGEVFFATSGGMVSYRGAATASKPEHAEVKIFPNPVSANFKGTVGISGLATDAIIKITDISGKLIWQTQANGGTATWHVADYNGRRAATGVYLVFSASKDGKDTFVGKIAVLN
ncbi:Putative surface antigen [Fulvivirga imtechensis AK7]|uniref:Putative surface antigen n=2 Tax=Fulvivirga TaxID=396811 RepID=L8JV37_9BACT|nr:Putative surface antigen [Fulvivirga imtechensis AK7]